METEKIANEEYINKMYDAQLGNKKEQLTQTYNQAISDLDAAKAQGQQNLQKNLNATAVENQRAQKNYAEVQNAYGLSSGAMAQARLAQDNQLQADLTTLRATQETADAGIEKERALLAQQYSSAITQAQAENDLARAEALYKEAKDAEAKLLAKQEGAAQLMAGVGDYSLLGQRYGRSPDQIAKLTPKSGGGVRNGGKVYDVPTVRQGELDSIVGEMVIDNYENGGSVYPYGYVAAQIDARPWSDAEKAYAKNVLNNYLTTPSK